MDLLEQEIDALGGHSASIGKGRTRAQLQAEVDEAARKSAEIETSTHKPKIVFKTHRLKLNLSSEGSRDGC